LEVEKLRKLNKNQIIFIQNSISAVFSDTSPPISYSELIANATPALEKTSTNEVHSQSAAFAVPGMRRSMEDR
jgi:hypothetical protein